MDLIIELSFKWKDLRRFELFYFLRFVELKPIFDPQKLLLDVD
jgi:hypothetical protein